MSGMHGLPHEGGHGMKDHEYQILTKDISDIKQSLGDIDVPMATRLAIDNTVEDIYSLYSGRGD